MDKININDFDDATIRATIDQLKFGSYCYNRQRSPEISPDKYVVIFGYDTYLYERMYQEGLKNDKR